MQPTKHPLQKKKKATKKTPTEHHKKPPNYFIIEFYKETNKQKSSLWLGWEQPLPSLTVEEHIAVHYNELITCCLLVGCSG